MPWQAVACQTTRKVLQSVLKALSCHPFGYLVRYVPEGRTHWLDRPHSLRRFV